MATSKVSAEKIAIAAEMSFDGISQVAIAKQLGFSQSRISLMQKTEVWQKTIARLEALKQKAEAEADKRQQLLYLAEADRKFDQSRRMGQVSASTYSKLMLAINAELDAALLIAIPPNQPGSNPTPATTPLDKIKAIESLKNLPGLIKAAVALQQAAFDRDYDEIEALKMWVEAGWLPRSILKIANDKTNELKSSIREAFAGIVPEREEEGRGLTAETAAAIRAHLLGIQSADATALPTELESGQ